MQDWSTYTDDQIRDVVVHGIVTANSRGLKDVEDLLERSLKNLDDNTRRFAEISIEEIQILLSFRAQLEAQIGPRCEGRCAHGTCELIRHYELENVDPVLLVAGELVP